MIGVWDDNGAYPGGFGSLTRGLRKDVSDVSKKEIGDTYFDMMVVAVMVENLRNRQETRMLSISRSRSAAVCPRGSKWVIGIFVLALLSSLLLRKLL